jgi:protein-arginine kinase activator protein McsA
LKRFHLAYVQAQLTEAVEQEDFKEAGRIKATIKAIEGEDVVREVVTMFEVRS